MTISMALTSSAPDRGDGPHPESASGAQWAQKIDLLLEQKNPLEALQRIDEALAQNPADARTYRQLGKALDAVGRSDDAIEAFNTACYYSENPWDCLADMGDLYIKLRNFDEAIRVYTLALSYKPDQGLIHTSIGLALAERGELDAARKEAELGVSLAPADPYPYYVLGSIACYQGRLEESIATLEQSIALDPEYAPGHTALGITRLMRGDLDPSSWEHYGWRFRRDPFQAPPEHFRNVPVWEGDSRGAKVLIWAEQGIGDIIFSLGFIRSLGLSTSQMYLCIDERLVPLCERSFPGVEVSGAWPLNPVENGITHTLPCCSAAGVALSASRGWHGTQFLLPDETQVQTFSSELRQMEDDILIGLSWMSTQRKYGANKSIPLQQFSALASIPGVRLVDLQYGETAEEREGFERDCGLSLLRPEFDRMKDLDTLSALIMACDYVVTVSNVTAHLAGSLGKQGWVLLPVAHGLFWFWKQEGRTSRWYPSLEIVAQQEAGSWSQELEFLRSHLLLQVAHGR